MKIYKISNLYAGLGGNRKRWPETIVINGQTYKVQVTAVEMGPEIAKVYQDQFPQDLVIIGDAHQYLKDHYKEFDFVWASPPCQKHSQMMKATRHDVADYIDLKLYQEIIFLKHFFKGKWVVENVKPYYEPLIKPTAILGRHYFWSNFQILNFKEPKQPKGFITSGTVAETVTLKKWLGIEYEGNIYYKDNHCPGQVLRNCVHPDLGLHVFNEHRRDGLFTF